MFRNIKNDIVVCLEFKKIEHKKNSIMLMKIFLTAILVATVYSKHIHLNDELLEKLAEKVLQDEVQEKFEDYARRKENEDFEGQVNEEDEVENDPAYEVKGSTFCKTKENGNYEDLLQCNGFIQCANGRTFRVNCPSNLNYNIKIDACDHQPCKLSGSVSTVTPTTPSVTQKITGFTRAICIFQGDVTGYIYFDQYSSLTEVHGLIIGLSPGLHGFNVHMFGDLSENCTKTEEYYGDVQRFPNINTPASGRTAVDIRSEGNNRALLIGPTSVIGRSLVIFSGQDNWGQKVACCVIGKANNRF